MTRSYNPRSRDAPSPYQFIVVIHILGAEERLKPQGGRPQRMQYGGVSPARGRDRRISCVQSVACSLNDSTLCTLE